MLLIVTFFAYGLQMVFCERQPWILTHRLVVMDGISSLVPASLFATLALIVLLF